MTQPSHIIQRSIPKQFLFLGIALSIATLISWYWGGWVDQFLIAEELQPMGWTVIPLVGTGWLVHAIISLSIVKERWMEYFKLLAIMMVIGVLLLLPGIGLTALMSDPHWLIPVVGVSISSGVMLLYHHQKCKAQNFPKKLSISWFISLQSTAAVWFFLG